MKDENSEFMLIWIIFVTQKILGCLEVAELFSRLSTHYNSINMSMMN